MRRKMHVSKGGGKTSLAVLGLRVALVPDEDGAWFAQGLDMDYFASGLTKEEAKENFEAGLLLAVKLYMQRQGSWESLKPSSEVMSEYSEFQWEKLTPRNFETVKLFAPNFPFSKVLYLEK